MHTICYRIQGRVKMILYMAPMKGFTDWVFRRVFAEHFDGFDLAIAPFIASQRDGPVRRRHVWPENNPRLSAFENLA